MEAVRMEGIVVRMGIVSYEHSEKSKRAKYY